MPNLRFFRLVVLLWLSSSAVFAVTGTPRPSWLAHPVVEDAEYKYYIGRASSAPTDAQAWSVATRDAYDTAIRENFGVQARVQSDDYQVSNNTSSEITITNRVSEHSAQVEIHEFEQADSFEDNLDNGNINLWVLFRYRKSAIEKEKKRLSINPKPESVPEFSEAGNDSDRGKGVVEIVSHPAGAVVYVDGERYGKAPLRLKGQLASGKHTIQLDHPSFAIADQQVVVTPGATAKVEVTLVRATGFLKVISEPPNASVWVDGKLVGVTPTENLIVPAGKVLEVEVSHADGERATQEITVDKGVAREIRLNLVMKPAYLSVISDPPGAVVTISERKPVKLTNSPTGLIRLEPKTYNIRVTKPGFEPYQVLVVLHGGDRTVLPVIRLQALRTGEGTEAQVNAVASGDLATRRKEIAQRWRAFVYRGFPDTNETRRCYLKKKVLVQELAADQLSPRYRGLKAIAEGNGDPTDPNYSAAIPLINQIIILEDACRKALAKSSPWDGT